MSIKKLSVAFCLTVGFVATPPVMANYFGEAPTGTELYSRNDTWARKELSGTENPFTGKVFVDKGKVSGEKEKLAEERLFKGRFGIGPEESGTIYPQLHPAFESLSRIQQENELNRLKVEGANFLTNLMLSNLYKQMPRAMIVADDNYRDNDELFSSAQTSIVTPEKERNLFEKVMDKIKHYLFENRNEEVVATYLPVHPNWVKMTEVEKVNKLNEIAVNNLYFLENLTVADIDKMPSAMVQGVEGYYLNNDFLFSPEVSSILSPKERGDLLQKLINRFRFTPPADQKINVDQIRQMMLEGAE